MADTSILSAGDQDPIAEKLDQEIEDLQTQVRRLKRSLDLHTTNILSSEHTSPLLSRLASPASSPDSLIVHTQEQLAHNKIQLYRACASVTTFRVSDPDPNALDSGRVLGLRIEAFSCGRYLRPYYIFLNKPFTDDREHQFRVHRHTVPEAIPLKQLARKWLPISRAGETLKGRKQDLGRFTREMRREIVGYHARVNAVQECRKRCGLEDNGNRQGMGSDGSESDLQEDMAITDVSIADAEARHIQISWRDGRTGRVLVGRKGQIERCVVVGDEGRDREQERLLMGGERRVEQLWTILASAEGYK